MAATIPGAGITTPLTLTEDGNLDTLTLKSTDADANSGPNIIFNRDSSSPADNDIVGQLTFRADNDAGQETDYCRFRTHLQDVSDGTEDGNFRLFTLVAGTEMSRISVASAETVFNEDSGNIDFRVESNDLDDCLFVNAGSNTVCIGDQAGNGSERLYIEQLTGDWVTVTENAVASGNIYMLNNKMTGQSPDNNVSYFLNFQDSGPTIRLRIFSDGDVQNHDNSYGSTSDSRIKQGIRDANSQWDDIKALKVRNYKRNDDVEQYGDKAWEQIGVIAQELEASGMDKLVKNEVLWDKDDPEVKNGTANEGDIKEYKGVKYSVLYMKAIKALQEAITRIEALEAK